MKLRQAEREDCDFFLKVRNEHDVYRFFRKDYPIKKTDHKKWYYANYWEHWVIEDKGKPVGFIRMQPLYEIGIAIPRKYWGKGYGTKAIEQIGKWKETMIAVVYEGNDRAKTVFTKNGFKKELPYFEMYRR